MIAQTSGMGTASSIWHPMLAEYMTPVIYCLRCDLLHARGVEDNCDIFSLP